MWGREMRAGLAFVIVALLIGQGFRSLRRGHEERFEDLVRELESRDSRDRGAHAARESAQAGATRVDSTAVGARKGAPAGSRSAPRGVPAGRIDPNRANTLELERLPGIGPALAGRIVADRERRGAFHSPEALLRVPGIGPKTLGRIRAYLSFPAKDGGDSLPGF
jgi:competence ComEA-like helix-hairpin-helix protein